MNDFVAAAKGLARLNFFVGGGGGLKESVGMAVRVSECDPCQS